MTQDCDSKISPSVGERVNGVRFTLKKRPIRNTNNVVNISSYNSDFLTGLFADVAKATVEPDCEGNLKRPVEVISSDEGCVPGNTEHFPSKKSRTLLHKSLSRVKASTMNLTSLGTSFSPKGINELFRVPRDSQANDCLESLTLNHHHQESLQFQLNCVSETSQTSYSLLPTIEDAAKIAFPNLPATVSDSSCNAGLTRVNLVRQASIPENFTKESFGWFVDLDDNTTPESDPSLPYAVSSDNLAFQAPTAPKRVNDEAELEWAQAADTIDDVLGDFF